MSYIKAERAAIKMLAYGYVHNSYEDEKKTKDYFFLERSDFIKTLESSAFKEEIFKYNDVLASTPLRGMKNGAICLVTQLCRIAIDFGVDNNFSYALSDYYIKELDNKPNFDEVHALVKSILLHYYDLVHRAFGKNYTKPINSAIRYIEMNLYGEITVSEIAGHIHLDKHYFATLFKKQTGYTPTEYIRKRKLLEAKRIFDYLGSSVTEVSENLCFCDVAYFSRCFKEEFHITPSQYKKDLRPDA